ncbi:MAG TPA: hypothetical protein VD993_16840 [Chitinophagaceae bacterium]|nr:hypothetical protein [Chitinophagaceae bacterium]
MFRILLFILAAVILYKLIFDFIIPVYRTSRQIRRRFRDMNQQMQDRMNQYNQQQQQQQREPAPKSKSSSDKDFIDFEEVK